MLQLTSRPVPIAEVPPELRLRIIVGMASRMVENMFEAGRIYTKCGVLLEDLCADTAPQADLFAAPDPRAPALFDAIDGINSRFGRETITLAVQGKGARGFDTKRSMKSPAWTTRIGETPIAR